MKRLYVPVALVLILGVLAVVPAAHAQTDAVRIRFAPGTIAATRSGQLNDLESDLYVLAAQGGQVLEAFVQSPGVLLYVWGPNGSELIPGAMQMAQWRVVLPANGDYFIAVNSTVNGAKYKLTVIVDWLTSGQATRIQFAPGGTSATVTGQVKAGVPARYVLRAVTDQTMEVTVSPRSGLLFAITGADGAVLKTFGEGGSPWRGLLARTQDYYVELVSPDAAASYRMTVYASPLGPTPVPKPVRISFKSGATSARVSGHVDPYETDSYVLRALAGQTMDVTVSPMGGPPCLAITGPGGSLLKRCASSGLEWHGKLPATGDYFIELQASDSQANYVLIVAISSLRPKPTPQASRIEFAPGGTSAVISAGLDPGGSVRWVVRARQGQTLMLHFTTTGAMSKQVDGPGGTSWQWPFVENNLRIPSLPATGDYFITLSAVEPGVQVYYTMEVTIPAG